MSVLQSRDCLAGSTASAPRRPSAGERSTSSVGSYSSPPFSRNEREDPVRVVWRASSLESALNEISSPDTRGVGLCAVREPLGNANSERERQHDHSEKLHEAALCSKQTDDAQRSA
ncbi:hypothetical protein MTO96_043703 [Rhipicephalus appendiculatus]